MTENEKTPLETPKPEQLPDEGTDILWLGHRIAKRLGYRGIRIVDQYGSNSPLCCYVAQAFTDDGKVLASWSAHKDPHLALADLVSRLIAAAREGRSAGSQGW